MRLYEHESKRVFDQNGIPIPNQFGVVHSVNEIDGLVINYPAMAKAAVLIGGRGKAGGIKKIHSLSEAKEVTASLLKLKIKEYPISPKF